MESLVLSQVINLEDNKKNYFIDFRKTIYAKYLTATCNYAPLILEIDAVKNNYTFDNSTGLQLSHTIVTNTHIKWPIINGRIESISLTLSPPNDNIITGNALFIVLQFFN